MGFIDRVGAALARPRLALAAAERGEGGMPDALALVLLKILCTETPLLVAGLWSLVKLGPGVALGVLSARLAAVVGTDLLLLALGGVAVTLLAGRRRDTTRDFDLAAVAWIPVLLVDTVATLGTTVVDAALPGWARSVLWAGALAWMARSAALGVHLARRRGS